MTRSVSLTSAEFYVFFFSGTIRNVRFLHITVMATLKTLAILSAGDKYSRTMADTAMEVFSDEGSFSYNVVRVEVNDTVSETLRKVNPDIAFISLTSPFFIDGRIQGLLEMLGIKYTHSGVTTSAVVANKVLCKQILQSIGIDTPEGYVVKRADILENYVKMPYPYVLKPINEGNSIGVHGVFSHDDFLRLKNNPSNIREEMLVEEYIPGIELVTPVFLDEALGTVENCLKNKKIYDYEAKRSAQFVETVFPAEVPESVYNLTMEWALKAHKFLGCKTVSRSDFRYDPEKRCLKMLELNTHPFLLDTSSVGIAAKSTKGIDTKKLFDILVQDSLNFYNPT